MAKKPFKPLRVLVGLVLMTGFVAGALYLLVQHAGGWGVPYFHFTTERGSHCRNDLIGFTCDQLTLADVEFYADIDLPDDTAVLSGSYHETHDYQLAAQLEVPPGSSAEALRTLQLAFGKCMPGHPSTLDTRGLAKVCVLANDDSSAQGEPTSRLYTIGTGLRPDGVRPIALAINSR